MRRNLTVLLALLLLLASCGTPASDAVDTNNTSVTSTETTNSDATTETELTLQLPDVWYEDTTITYLTADPYVDHFRLITELTGEPLSDAAFNRNLSISDRLGVEFAAMQVDVSNVASTLQNAVAAGDTTYSYVFPHATMGVPTMVSGGLLYNVYELPVIELDMPWWNDGMTDALSIGNTAYYLSGDIVMTWQGMGAVLFNKEYLIDYNIDENLYDLVREGKWTIDKMMSIIDGVGKDLNGDGKITNKDQFGLLTNGGGQAFTLSFDQRLTDRDENGYPVLALNTEKMVSIVEKYYALMHSTDVWHDTYSSATYATSSYRDIVIEGRSFLMLLDIGSLYTYLREIDYDFGILPMPKYDEMQKEYHTFCGAGLIGVPVNTPDPQMSGAVLEALAYYSYKLVRPVYFDVVLENKTVRDQDSYEMITLMHESKTWDFGFNFDTTGKCSGMLDAVVIDKDSTDFASYYASVESSITAGFKKFIEDFEGN